MSGMTYDEGGAAMSSDAIRARWGSVGPWGFTAFSEDMFVRYAVGPGDPIRSMVARVTLWQDAERIAAAPADISTLLAALDTLTAERDAALARVAELEAKPWGGGAQQPSLHGGKDE